MHLPLNTALHPQPRHPDRLGLSLDGTFAGLRRHCLGLNRGGRAGDRFIWGSMRRGASVRITRGMQRGLACPLRFILVVGRAQYCPRLFSQEPVVAPRRDHRAMRMGSQWERQFPLATTWGRAGQNRQGCFHNG